MRYAAECADAYGRVFGVSGVPKKGGANFYSP
jgi:hypothetical protein